MSTPEMNTQAQVTPPAKSTSPVPGASPSQITGLTGREGRGRTLNMVATEKAGHLTLITGEQDITPALGADGTPVHEAPEITADRCARQADELAAHVENVARLAKAMLHGPACPDSAWTQKFTRIVMAQLKELRVVVNGLGELHTEIDELVGEISSPRASHLIGGA